MFHRTLRVALAMSQWGYAAPVTPPGMFLKAVLMLAGDTREP